jgi:hypothetical protein
VIVGFTVGIGVSLVPTSGPPVFGGGTAGFIVDDAGLVGSGLLIG